MRELETKDSAPCTIKLVRTQRWQLNSVKYHFTAYNLVQHHLARPHNLFLKRKKGNCIGHQCISSNLHPKPWPTSKSTEYSKGSFILQYQLEKPNNLFSHFSIYSELILYWPTGTYLLPFGLYSKSFTNKKASTRNIII